MHRVSSRALRVSRQETKNCKQIAWLKLHVDDFASYVIIMIIIITIILINT